jgi:hypothetical protein
MSRARLQEPGRAGVRDGLKGAQETFAKIRQFRDKRRKSGNGTHPAADVHFLLPGASGLRIHVRHRPEGGKVNSITFTMFRITVHRDRNLPLLPVTQPAPEILRHALVELASPTDARMRWRIGNLSPIDTSAFYFCFGRTGQTNLPQTNDAGDFVEQKHAVAPFAHVVVDTTLEVCAIAKSPKLSPHVETVGRALSINLCRSEFVKQALAEIELATIKDPQEFLDKLRSAHSVRRFWVTVRRPNPFDVEADFVRPTSKIVESLGANEAKTEWVGDTLNVEQDQVEEIVKSAAACGGDSGATVRTSETARTSRIGMKWNAGVFSIMYGDEILLRVEALNKLRSVYQKIRGRV